MRIALPLLLLATPMAAGAQADDAGRRAIQVVGSGMVETPPNVARIDFWVVGEGKTADEASRALAEKQKAITTQLSALLGRGTEITTSNVTVIQARGEGCQTQGYNAQPRLSEGACAVTGYLVNMQGAIRTGSIDKAATAAGLAVRLGARDARLQGFDLANKEPARRAALADAIKDARAKAEAIAAGANARLGQIITIRDQIAGGGEIIVMGQNISHAVAAPPPPPAVEIEVQARPIETRAQVYVAYAIQD